MQSNREKSLLQRQILHWVVGLGVAVVGWCGGGMGVQEAAAQEVSYKLRLPRISDRSRLARQMHSKIRSILMNQGFVIRPMRSIRQGYHLDISVAVEESFPSDDAASCTLQLALQIVILPQKRLVMTATSSGSSRFNKATKFTRQKRDHLRRLAISKAMHYFRGNLRRSIRKIEAKKKTLSKDRILGQKWRRGSRARWHRSGQRGKPLAGKTPHWKWIRADLDAVNHRPPFAP